MCTHPHPTPALAGGLPQAICPLTQDRTTPQVSAVATGSLCASCCLSSLSGRTPLLQSSDFWDRLSNKLLAPASLSQGLLLREPKSPELSPPNGFSKHPDVSPSNSRKHSYRLSLNLPFLQQQTPRKSSFCSPASMYGDSLSRSPQCAQKSQSLRPCCPDCLPTWCTA